MDRWTRIETIFFGALDVDTHLRETYLAEACADDADLCTEVEAMLHAHETASALALEHRFVGDDAPVLSQLTDQIGTRIGAYRLIEHLGQGGMADVYLAERDDGQYRQQVALKLLRRGPHYADVLQRFRAERQILARLTHPNIARLLDGGVTQNDGPSPDGQPYLVMEYIDGVPITDFCDQHRLPIAERLDLFRQVCQAVQFAHQNLVVHRDLKPSNVLVIPSKNGGTGTPKLLDFGIAKLLNPEVSDISVLQTRSHIRVMTPAYAAPEQVRGEPVQTTTDVYALGVLLYELLTGHLPFQLSTRIQTDIDRIILEQDPVRPSTAVSKVVDVTQADGQTRTITPDEVSRQRHTQPEKLRQQLRGDLDNMVMMALRKEPQRRYTSAEQLAEDITRYLEHRPLIARSDTLKYRTQKFLARNKIGVLAGTAVAVLLLGFSVLTWVQGRQVARERDRVEAERDKAEQVVQVMVDLFETTNPEIVPGGDTLQVGTFLTRIKNQSLQALAGQPEVQARMQQVLGRMYTARSDFDEAQALLEEALKTQQTHLGANAPEVLRTQHLLALLTRDKEDRPAAEPLLRASLERHRRVLGNQHIETARAMHDLADVLVASDEAEELALLEEALAVRRAKRPAQHLDIALNLWALGEHYRFLGDTTRTRHYKTDALAMLTALLGANHPRTLELFTALQTDRSARLAALRKLLAVRRSVYGPASMPVATTLNNIGVNLVIAGSLATGTPHLQEALALQKGILGNDHWDVANAARNVSIALQFQGRYDEALPYMKEAVEMVEQVYGPEGLSTGYFKSQHSELLRKMSRHEEALQTAQKSVAILRNAVPEDGDYRFREALMNLGAAYVVGGAPEQAEPVLREALRIQKPALGGGVPAFASLQYWLGRTLVALNQYTEAEPLLRESYAVLKDAPAHNAPLAEEARKLLMETYIALGQPEHTAPLQP